MIGKKPIKDVKDMWMRKRYEIPPREELMRMSRYFPSVVKIAEHYKVSVRTVGNWLKFRRVLTPEKMALKGSA